MKRILKKRYNDLNKSSKFVFNNAQKLHENTIN